MAYIRRPSGTLAVAAALDRESNREKSVIVLHGLRTSLRGYG
ncbi:hypothetical protein [Sphingomonas sp. 37zxx]|nr:hypothetical protein [Sphingomonas sp. 37zxx]